MRDYVRTEIVLDQLELRKIVIPPPFDLGKLESLLLDNLPLDKVHINRTSINSPY